MLCALLKLVTLTLVTAFLALTYALHLALYLKLVLAVGLTVIERIFELSELLTGQTGQFLIGLSLTDGTYGVLNHGVGVLDKLISFLLGLTYD